jgi:hypothetical protein
MHHQPVTTNFLHVLNVESGLWAEMPLGSPVSPLSLEAMNTILFKDGILAYIGQRSEFGQFVSKLTNETDKGIPHCWTSLPSSTVMSKLGLCLNMRISARPEMVLYGSPLTVALTYIMTVKKNSNLFYSLKEEIERAGFLYLSSLLTEELGFDDHRMINVDEFHEALSYLD